MSWPASTPDSGPATEALRISPEARSQQQLDRAGQDATRAAHAARAAAGDRRWRGPVAGGHNRTSGTAPALTRLSHAADRLTTARDNATRVAEPARMASEHHNNVDSHFDQLAQRPTDLSETKGRRRAAGGPPAARR